MLSKIATWLVWSALALFVVFLFEHRHEPLKPAANHLVNQVESALGHVVFISNDKGESLSQARAAYAKGDPDAAIDAYQDYLQSNPDDVDARGELGNVYYSQGNLTEAAQTYYDTASRLIEQKKLDRVHTLLPLIGQINPPLESDLMAKLAHTTNQEQRTRIEPLKLNQESIYLPQSARQYY
jgi:tetratricopeptide (TPR) repeat protein